MRTKKILLLLLVVHALTGCTTYSLEELRKTTPKGTPFQAALAVNYLRFAEDEAANYDWVDSSYFAQKGLVLAYGNDAEPEGLDKWELTTGQRAEAREAREKLIEALSRGAVEDRPTDAAAAQFYFDCWLENMDEGWQEEQIAYCHDNMKQAIERLTAAPEEAKPDEEANTEGTPEQPAQEKRAYIVFFGSNKADLDDNGERLVDGVVSDIQKNGSGDDYTVVLNGHTDTTGSSGYNMELSKRRAEAVEGALVARGIPKSIIRAFGFGETDPKVPTKDGVKEPQNRRVEIFIGND